MLLKKASRIILVLVFFLLTCQSALAASSYVLPYPGLMPGHKLYKIKQVFDRLYYFWVFGNFSHHRYELSLADKKLVEAKVLFEYQQYLLGSQALSDSNKHFQGAVDYLNKAEKEGKDISQKIMVFKAAAEKHQEVLEKLKQDLPEQFLWQPEKREATELLIKKSLDEAIEIRHFN